MDNVAPTGSATEKPKLGRPTSQSPEIEDEICRQIAIGRSLVTITREIGISYATVMNWLQKDSSFLDRYTRAKEEQADYLADEIIALADEEPPTQINKAGVHVIDSGWVTNQRNRIEARKWTAAKLKPKKYGDRQMIEHSGSVKHEHTVTALSNDQLMQQIGQLDTAELPSGVRLLENGNLEIEGDYTRVVADDESKV